MAMDCKVCGESVPEDYVFECESCGVWGFCERCMEPVQHDCPSIEDEEEQ